MGVREDRISQMEDVLVLRRGARHHLDYIDIQLLRLEEVGSQPHVIPRGEDVAAELKELRVTLHKMEETKEELAAWSPRKNGAGV